MFLLGFTQNQSCTHLAINWTFRLIAQSNTLAGIERKKVAFLAKHDIRERIQRGQLIADAETQFKEKYLHQSSYDLRLGPEIYIVADPSPKFLITVQPYFSIPPGQFAILTTLEMIVIPDDLMALISIRSKFKFQGLVNISGFHVDPSFKGRLRFGVQNVGPTDIHLKLETPLFTIFFAELSSGGIEKTRDEENDTHFEQNLTGLRLEDVQLLGGSSITLSGIQKQIEKLEVRMIIYGGFVVAAAVGLLLKFIFGK
jgi:dCTP deaminase